MTRCIKDLVIEGNNSSISAKISRENKTHHNSTCALRKII